MSHTDNTGRAQFKRDAIKSIHTHIHTHSAAGMGWPRVQIERERVVVPTTITDDAGNGNMKVDLSREPFDNNASTDVQSTKQSALQTFSPFPFFPLSLYEQSHQSLRGHLSTETVRRKSIDFIVISLLAGSSSCRLNQMQNTFQCD